MNIKFKIGKFLEALDIVYMTVDKKGSLDTKDILLSAGIKDGIPVLYLYSTDFANQGLVKLTDVTITEEGTVPFNPNQLYAALSKRDPEAEAQIVCDTKQSVIKVAKSKFKLDTTKSQTLLTRMLAVPLDGSVLLELNPEDVTDILKRAKVCVSIDVNNTNKYILRGLHIKNDPLGYRVGSTDGVSASSITISQTDAPTEIDIIIPGEFTSILLQLCSKAKKLNSKLQIIKNNYIYFKIQNIIVGTSVMVGKFPAIYDVIDNSTPDCLIPLDLTTLKACLDRLLSFDGFSANSSSLVQLEIEAQTLKIKAISVSDCEEFVDFGDDIIAPPYNSKINGRRLLEIVSTSSLGTATLGIPNVFNKPLYIEEVIPNKLAAKYVIMPTR